MRQDPFTPDEFDGQRAAWAKRLWHSQDNLLRQRDRQIEENIRVLLGQQWIVWDDLRGRYVDVSRYLERTERRWRQMPVMNRLLLWYMTMHARMTENPPRITFQAGPDRIDAVLAEAMDTVYAHVYGQADVQDVLSRAFSWLIPSGQVFLKSRIDPLRGDPLEQGPALVGPDGMPIQAGSEAQMATPTGPDPYYAREGGICVDVCTAFEMRGEWGPRPWHEKTWHVHRTYLTEEQAFEAFGREIKGSVHGSTSENSNSMFRVLYGGGLFGAADDASGGLFSDGTDQQPMVPVYEVWKKPSRFPGQEERPGMPGGRLLIVAGEEVIRDGPRYAAFKYTSPIRCLNYVGLPGRPSGTSPQEMLNGPVRTRNRLMSQALAHATLAANPIQMIDTATGIKQGEIKNQPGQQVYGNFSHTGADPIRYAAPPSLGSDVYRTMGILTDEVNLLGSVSGTEGEAPTQDASGELVKELRYNSDRVVGPTMREAVREIGRMAEDWMVMIPIIWDTEKIIQVAGEDNIARTITVAPYMFEQGNVNVRPEIESMLPESRGERQRRAWAMFREGLFGDPMSPEARHFFLEIARFPDMGRAYRPGGIDRTTAEQNVGKILAGTPAQQIPIYEWYAFDIHVQVLEQYMKSPEFLRLDDQMKQELVIYRTILKQAQIQAMLMQQQDMMGLAAQQTMNQVAATAGIQQIAQAQGLMPPAPDGAGGPPERGATRETPGEPESAEGAA